MRFLALALLLALSASASAKPNIVVILADDLGVGDVRGLNPQGKIATPHLDRLAAAGMTFTDAHSPSAVCSPTRYGLMTGRYAWRTKLQSGVLGGLSPRLIEPDRETIASLLKKAGYHTGCVGKWHLGMDWELKPGKAVTELNIEPRAQVFNVEYLRPIKNGPNAVGFDEYFGISASLDMVPYAFIRNDKLTAEPSEDRSLKMRPDKPATTRLGPAAPGFTAEGVLPRCTEEAVAFLERRAKEPAKPFFLYVPLTSPHTPIAPTKEFDGKSGIGPYGDFVVQTDAAVGTLMDALAKLQLADNTLVIFTSDNGCSPQADFPDLAKKGHNPNHVYRGNKADIFEGGHRVPFLTRWPGTVKPGTTSERLVCLTDVLQTAAAIAQVPVPDAAGEDSVSFLPTLRGEAQPARSAVVHHSINGSFAIREGDWKLCLCADSGGWSAPRPGAKGVADLPKDQLFNLKSDIGETKNLHAEEPMIVKRLTEALERIVADGRSTPGPKGANAVPVVLRKRK
ncbi:MAG: arylsulfatase [Gemmataceae bacterium]|nr:arylsulfatase [Gemmataceae bacterium]